MTSRWWRVYNNAVDDATLQMMSPREFVRKLRACFRGEQNEFSRFIKRGRDRPSGPEWARLRSLVFKRDNFTCQYCGARGVRLECDHVVPVARGGQSVIENLAAACFPCNRSKRDHLLEEWRR